MPVRCDESESAVSQGRQRHRYAKATCTQTPSVGCVRYQLRENLYSLLVMHAYFLKKLQNFSQKFKNVSKQLTRKKLYDSSEEMDDFKFLLLWFQFDYMVLGVSFTYFRQQVNEVVYIYLQARRD